MSPCLSTRTRAPKTYSNSFTTTLLDLKKLLKEQKTIPVLVFPVVINEIYKKKTVGDKPSLYPDAVT